MLQVIRLKTLLYYDNTVSKGLSQENKSSFDVDALSKP